MIQATAQKSKTPKSTENNRVYHCNISDRISQISIYPNAIELKRPNTFAKPKTQPRKTRSEITTFSKASRKRLLDLMSKISEEETQNAYFLTLTYPLSSQPTTSKAKRDLKVWTQRQNRFFQNAKFIWKMEFTKNQTIHFHILLLLPFKLSKDQFKAEIHRHKRAWFEICQTENPDHFRAGTRFESPRNRAKLVKYLGKYISKVDFVPADFNPGRIWGKSQNLLPGLPLTIECTVNETRSLIDLFLDIIESRSKKPMSDEYRYWTKLNPTVTFYVEESEALKIVASILVPV